MKIQLFSDLHQEFYWRSPSLGDVVVHPEAEVVVLAGDIHAGKEVSGYARALAEKYGKPVIFVPGNHEYYNQEYAELEKLFKAESGDGVHILLDDTVVIGGVRFVGGTLWTDFRLYEGTPRLYTRDEAFKIGTKSLHDFKCIQENGLTFTAQRSAEWHEKTRAYIENVLASPFDGATVVVTHHAPHQNSIHERYAPSKLALTSGAEVKGENPYWKLNVCFASNLGAVVDKADVWLHGHVHDSFEYTVGMCRVYANPRGYPRQDDEGRITFENAKYESFKLINV